MEVTSLCTYLNTVLVRILLLFFFYVQLDAGKEETLHSKVVFNGSQEAVAEPLPNVATDTMYGRTEDERTRLLAVVLYEQLFFQLKKEVPKERVV